MKMVSEYSPRRLRFRPHRSFWLKVIQGPLHPVLGTHCWDFDGALNDDGYGVFREGTFFWKAHRYAFAEIKGEIKDDYVLDHLCMRRSCCRPLHLDMVTQEINLQRMHAHQRSLKVNTE